MPLVPSQQLVLLLVPQDLMLWDWECSGSGDFVALLGRLANWNFQPSHQLKLLRFCAH
jgi:hypothetical protein